MKTFVMLLCLFLGFGIVGACVGVGLEHYINGTKKMAVPTYTYQPCECKK